MASIFKRKYTKIVNEKRVKKQSLCWYIKYRDADGIERRVKAFKDKIASQQLAAKLEKEAEMAKAGVVDRYKEYRKRLLLEHLADFEQSLLAKGCTTKHVEQVVSRARKIIEGCKFRTWTDISASKVQYYLASLRNRDESISAQTFNFYLQNIKQFCKWMVQDGRASESPLQHLKGLNVRTDRRHDRRALEPDEVRRLLETTTAAPERFGMMGCQRAMLYRLAVETGLRASELRSLTVSSFDLNKCTVTIEAAYSKHRRQDVLPLRPSTAAELQNFLAGKMPNIKVFNMPVKQAKMMRADLAEANIPYVDDSGRYADFHSLRHTTGSWLAANNVHPKVAQSIMRHSDINLTMSRYTHTLTGQESEAVSKLPDLSLPSSQSQMATGTDNQSISAVQNVPEKLTPQLTPKSTLSVYSECNRPAAVVTPLPKCQRKAGNHKTLQMERLDNESEELSPCVTTNMSLRPAGFEPATSGLGNRCSILLSYERKDQ
jgi:integrase